MGVGVIQDVMPSAKGFKVPKNAQLTGLGVLVVVIVVSLGYLAWRMRKGLGETADGLSSAVGGISTALGAAGQGVGDVATIVTSPFKGIKQGVDRSVVPFFGGSTKADRFVTADDFKSGRPDLRLEVLDKKDSGGNWSLSQKRTVVKVRVTANGRPVQGAEIAVRLTHPGTKWTSDNIDRHFTDIRGETTVSWWVRDLPGTAAEDDAILQAKAAGYNPSNRITAK